MKDFQLLITDYFEETIVPEDLRALVEHLHDDPANMREFMRAALLRAQLRELLMMGLPGERGEERRDVASPFVGRGAEGGGRIAARGSGWRRRVMAAAAVVAVLVGVGWFYLLRGGGVGGAGTGAPVATLARAVGARWAAGGVGLGAGDAMGAARYELASGYAEVVFGKGAVALMEGPAVFELESPSRMRLVSGMLTTYVAGAAHGFAVDVKGASVVDLGTEVGISADGAHGSHVEVFTGQARVDVAATGERRILTAHMAVRVDAAGMEEAEAEPLAFTRDGQLAGVAAGAAGAARWEAERRTICADPTLVADYGFADVFTGTGVLKNRAMATGGMFDGKIEGATWQAGRFPGEPALRFNGGESRVRIDIPTPLPSVTVAMWLKLAHPNHPVASLLMSDGERDRMSLFHLHLSQREGRPVIEFRTPTPGIGWNSYTFNGAELVAHPNQWRFLAVAYDTRVRVISCWLDDTCLGTHLIPSHPEALVLGPAEIGNWNDKGAKYGRGLNGQIDGLSIWSRALGGKEIEAIYEAGVAPGRR